MDQALWSAVMLTCVFPIVLFLGAFLRHEDTPQNTNLQLLSLLVRNGQVRIEPAVPNVLHELAPVPLEKGCVPTPEQEEK